MTFAIEPLRHWLLDSYVLSTGVLLAAAPVLIALGQPARRLAVCRALLGGLLALLVLGLLPAWPRVGLLRVSEASRAVAPAPAATRSALTPGRMESDEAQAAARSQPGAEAEASQAESPRSAPPAPRGDRTAVATPWFSDLPALVVRAYVVGAGLMLAWLAIGSWQLAALRRRSRRASDEARAALSRVSGRAEPPELLVNDALRQPVAAGLVRPTIILPGRFLDEPANRLEAALAHEWGHIHNGDLGMIAMLRLLLPVLFAHPVYWWLRRRIRDDQEALADASAAGVEGRLGYAEILLAWSRGASERPWCATGGSVALFERSSQLKRRIVMLLDGEFRIEPQCPARWNLAARMVTAAVVIGASFLTLRPSVVGADDPKTQAEGRVEAAVDSPDVEARLLDPDGNPVAGAKVYKSPVLNGLKRVPGQAIPLGETGPDGTFRHAQKARPDGLLDPIAQVFAVAEGYGPGFVDPTVPDGAKFVRLVKDDVPIRGRILDVQGRPVAGATVGVVGIIRHPSGDLDPWLAALQKEQAAYPVQYEIMREWASDDVPAFFPPVRTDEDGRFVIHGVGRDRIASLLVAGPGIETTFEYVATRIMPSVKVRDFPQHNGSRDITYYGAEFDLVVGPELVAVGTVTDKDTGRPLAGVTVGTTALFGNPLRTLWTTTDTEGRYRLAGMPPKTQFNDDQDLLAEPAEGLPYLPSTRHLGTTEGTGPIVVDLQLKRGVRAKGRVIDKSTGKGIRARLAYYILSDNPNLKEYPRYGTIRAAMPNSTDDDGNFELVVMPGPGVIGARAGNEHFSLGQGGDSMPGGNQAGDDNGFIRAEPSHLIINNYHTVLGFDAKPGDESFSCEIALERGRSVNGRVVGPDGEPLAGARIEGLQDYFRAWSYKPLESAEFLVEGIAEGASRDLLAIHEGKKMAGAFVVGPDETGPITLKLGPCGVVTGRLVDAGGLPLVGVEMSCFGATFDDAKHEAGSLPDGLKTDAEGRFRAEGLVPGRKYHFRAWKTGSGGRMDMFLDVARDVVAAAGETRDLGDLTLQAAE